MNFRLRQYQNESDTWKRMVAFMEEECIQLKNRLSAILNDEFNQNMLVELELFQNEFVKADVQLFSLRNQLLDLDRLLIREIFEDGFIMKQVQRMIRSVRHEVHQEATLFQKVKLNFYTYLEEMYEAS